MKELLGDSWCVSQRHVLFVAQLVPTNLFPTTSLSVTVTVSSSDWEQLRNKDTLQKHDEKG